MRVWGSEKTRRRSGDVRTMGGVERLGNREGDNDEGGW